MDIRNHPGSRLSRRRGVTTIQMLVLLVPVFFGLMGFAVDLGRLYMIRGELQTAANNLALAAAGSLDGTDAAMDKAASAEQLAAAPSGNRANQYDYGGVPIGGTTGNLESSVSDLQFFDTVGDATGASGGSGAPSSSGATARHLRVLITADAPLVFWNFLPAVFNRKTPIQVSAVAGISAPLCQACGIEAIAVAALDPTDTVDYGMVQGNLYTLGYVCNGAGAPGPLAGTIQRLPYLLLNRLDQSSLLFPDESAQTLRIGAGGLPGNVSEAQSCVLVNNLEQVWITATALTCAMNRVPPAATGFVCGVATRFEAGVYPGCETIADSDTAAAPFIQDTDTTYYDTGTYASYTGNRRRIITIPIVDSLLDPMNMTVLGFRQFLINPIPNSTNVNPTDTDARLIAMYIGSQVPVRQGRFDSTRQVQNGLAACTLTAGPGKVVLHQ